MTGDRRLRWIGAVVVLCACAAGCTAVATKQSTLPVAYTLVRDQLLIHSDFSLPAHHRLLDEVCARRGDIAQLLGLPASDEPIHVYLFETADRFNTFVRLHHPEFPHRRAFFLETDTRLQVYAQWGDHVAEDLRHEVCHGYLHAAVPRLPLWLDEGLAEFFEVPRGHRGLNESQLGNLIKRLQAGKWTPNMARLEALDPTSDLSGDDYAESWGWVHFLLESDPAYREIVCRYLYDLRHNEVVEPLPSRLARQIPDAQEQLVAHLRGLAEATSRTSRG